MFYKCNIYEMNSLTPLRDRVHKRKNTQSPDDEKGRPVLDEGKSKVRTWLRVEDKTAHHKLYWNCGLVSWQLRRGSMGDEDVNQKMKQNRWHLKSPSPVKLYQRMRVFFIKNNAKMFKRWMPHFEERWPELADLMKALLMELSELSMLKDSAQGLVPRINISKRDIVIQCIKRMHHDELKFNFKSEKWGVCQEMMLQRIVVELDNEHEDSGWVLNENILETICQKFKSKQWSSYEIRTRLSELGIDYAS